MTPSQVKKIEQLIKKQAQQFNQTGHDINHFFRTRDKALKIVRLLNLSSKIDLNTLQAACLLHDYIYLNKPHFPFSTFYRYIWEGDITALKIKKVLKKIQVVKKDQKIILAAIKNHPHSFPWSKLNQNKNIYDQILQDADTLDLLKLDRVQLIKKQDWLTKLISPFLLWSHAMGRKYRYLFLNFPELNIYFNENHQYVFKKWDNKNSKKTIICLHGYASSHLMFAPLAEKIKKEYQVISLELPYWKFNQIFKIDELSRYLENFRQKLNLEKFTLVGFSLGGLTATSYAINHPQHINRLILLNSLPKLLPKKSSAKIYSLLKPLFITRFSLFIYSRFLTSTSIRKLRGLQPTKKDKKQRMRKHFFAVFGALINNLDFNQTQSFNQLKLPKTIVLFKDDLVIRYKKFYKYAQSLETKLIVKEIGGHNKKPGYWREVEKIF